MKFQGSIFNRFSYRLVFTAFAHLNIGAHEFDAYSCYLAKFALFSFILTAEIARQDGRFLYRPMILSITV